MEDKEAVNSVDVWIFSPTVIAVYQLCYFISWVKLSSGFAVRLGLHVDGLTVKSDGTHVEDFLSFCHYM